MKKKKAVKVWIIILAVVIIISAVIGGGFAFLNAKLNKINRVDSKPEEVVDPSMETYETGEGLTDTWL